MVGRDVVTVGGGQRSLHSGAGLYLTGYNPRDDNLHLSLLLNVLDREEILDLLGQLVDKSLIEVLNVPGEETRYRMLTASHPEDAKRLLIEAQTEVEEKWRLLEHLSKLDYSIAAAAPKPAAASEQAQTASAA